VCLGLALLVAVAPGMTRFAGVWIGRQPGWTGSSGTAFTKEPALIPAGRASNPARPWILI